MKLHLQMDLEIHELEQQLVSHQLEAERLAAKVKSLREAVLRNRISSQEESLLCNRLKRIQEFCKPYKRVYDTENGRRVEYVNVSYAFRKREAPYSDDWGAIMRDPLDFAIAEYDLIGLSQNVDIRIDYYHECVKEFVKSWMASNMRGAKNDAKLFAFKNESLFEDSE